MIDHLLIFEGLDGTGKTTTASKIIQLSTAELPIHYIYFSKKESTQETYEYFYNLVSSFEAFVGVVVMDRSVLSTYAYSLDTIDFLRYFEFVKDYDPLIIYFYRVYDKSKLVSDWKRIQMRYEKAIQFLKYNLQIPVIMTDAETIQNRINSLDKLQHLLKNKELP